MLVLTADQRGSRLSDDLVPAALEAIAARAAGRLALPADRNAGDEIQAATEDGDLALEIALDLVRSGDWAVGIGAGSVERPLADQIRAARGSAFIHARAAVERAKATTWHLAVEGDDPVGAEDAEALIRLVLEVRMRRTDAGWEVFDRLTAGRTQKEIALELGITETAVSLRAKAAGLRAEEAALPALGRVLDRLGRSTVGAA
jgi:DNA-binding NarL/FixJ family response regulator